MVLAVVALMGTAVGAQERERLISEAQGLVSGVLSDAQLDSLARGRLIGHEFVAAEIGMGSWEPCESEMDARRERFSSSRTSSLTGSWELGWDDGMSAYSLWDDTWVVVDWAMRWIQLSASFRGETLQMWRLEQVGEELEALLDEYYARTGEEPVQLKRMC